MGFANGYFVDKYTYKLKSVCSITILVFNMKAASQLILHCETLECIHISKIICIDY